MGKRITVTEKEILDEGYRRAYAPDQPPAPKLSRLQRGQTVRAAARAVRHDGLTEAELLQVLQQRGIGRPSTYAETLAALRRHQYIQTQDGRLVMTDRGRAALDWLNAHYPDLFAPDFSAHLEALLDALARGEVAYRQVVGDVWEKVSR